MQALKIHSLVSELLKLVNPFDSVVHARIVASGHPTMEVSEGTMKEKLRRVEAELGEARSERVDLVKARDLARDDFARDPSTSTGSPQYTAARDAQRALGECDERILDLQAIQLEALRLMGRDAPDARSASVNGDRNRGDAPPWPGQMTSRTREVLADTALRERLASLAGSQKQRIGAQMPLGEVITRDAFVADVTGTTNMRRGEYIGIVPQLRRQFRLLELIPTGTMDANSIPYTQESGSFATAVETTEGTAKPEAAVTLTDQEAYAATIAHWLKLRKQALADTPALQTLIDGRLRYGVELRLENEILGGDGSGANMRGILQTSGLGVVSYDATKPLADLILDGLVNVILAYGEGNAIVMNPLDWKQVLTAKAKYTASTGVIGGSGEYVGGGPFNVAPQQMWGVPLIPSVAVAQGTALVGDFARGAQLFIRQGIVVLLSDSDADDFTTNRVTMLAEMRAALAVFRPVLFQTVALA